MSDDGLRLVDARGGLARWPDLYGYAALADPPRLAIMRGDGNVEIIDATTGAVQRLIERDIAPLAFSGDGSRLFAVDAEGETAGSAVVIDERGDVRALGVTCNANVTSKRGDVAGVRFADRRGVIVDVDGRVVPIGSGNACRPLAFSDDGERVATIGNDRVIEQWDARSGRELRDRPSFTSGHVVALWLSPDLDDVAVLESDGTVRRRRRSDRGDARGQRGMRPRARGPLLAHVRVHGGHGTTVVDGARSSDACFTPRGAFVGIRDGRAVLFHDNDSVGGGVVGGGGGGDAKLVEGPTSLVSLTPHPRGVLAVDDEDRAHVLAIDDDVRDRSGEVSS